VRAVLERDFLAEASRPRSFWFRAGAAICVSAVILFVVVDNTALFRDSPDRVARTLFLGGAFSLLGLLALLTPVGVVGSILEERQRETLVLVLSTPGSPVGFVAAKLLSRAAAVLVWALAAVVPLSVVALMGGVAGGDLADLLLLSAAIVLELAAWGVWVSSVTRRLATGAVLAYLLPALRWGLVALACIPLFERPRAMADWRLPTWVLHASWIGFATTPVPSCMRMADRTDYDRFVGGSMNQGRMTSIFVGRIATPMTQVFVSGGRNVIVPVPGRSFLVAAPAPAPPPTPPFSGRDPTLTYFLFSALLALLSLLVAGKRLQAEAEPRTSLLARWKAGRRWFRSLPGTGNPMLWKESRLLNTAASRPLYYSVLGLFVLGELVFLTAVGMGELLRRDLLEAALGMTTAHACLLGLVAAIAGASSMAHERSTGSLDLLRVSLLTPREILRGKVTGALLGLRLLALVPVLGHLGVLAAAGFLHPVVALVGLLVLVVSVHAWLALGMIAGTLSFRVGRAVSLAAGAFGGILAGVPLLSWLLDDGFGAHDAAEALMGVWPPGTCYSALEAAAMSSRGDDAFANWIWLEYGIVPRFDDYHVAAVVTLVLLAAGAALFHAQGHRLLAWRLRREGEAG